MICQLRAKPDFQPLLTNNLPLDHLSSHKVVGIMLCNTLKWNDNINAISRTTASRRLYIKAIVTRWDPFCDLVAVYFTQVRSVSEYCCLLGQQASQSISGTILRGSRKELCVFFSQKRTIVMLSYSVTSLVSIIEEANYYASACGHHGLASRTKIYQVYPRCCRLQARSWLTRPMRERQGREQCLQGKVMSGVVVEAARAFLLASGVQLRGVQFANGVQFSVWYNIRNHPE